MKVIKGHAFKGGVHPHDFKEISKDRPIETAPVPEILYVPVAQHIGAPAKPIVKKGDEVKKGQLIAEPGGFVSAKIHAPVSGIVKAVEPHIHIFGAPAINIVIENDGKEEWAEGVNVERDYSALDAGALKEAIGNAGLVGMGGATFPTHVKLSPPPNKNIDTVILNGVECEPYLTSDYRLMLESPETILEGLKILVKAVGASKAYIGIEANKPDAADVMDKKAREMEMNVEIVLLPVMYPQGAEKQLIYAITKKEVPSGGLPMDVGCLVQNVGTAHAAYEAVKFNKPLIERIVTFTGNGVKQPANMLCRVGTRIDFLLEKLGKDPEVNKLILGGPMMGLAHFTDEIPIIKGTSGVLLLKDAEVWEEGPCIRCGKCVEGCPVGLLPSTLSVLGEAKRFDHMEEYNVLDCIECGVCTYQCPAKRPIIQYIKLGKAEVMSLRRAAQAKAAEEAEKK